jgi:hypothetical protein
MKRILDDDSISTGKRFHGDRTCLFDLPNKILLMIFKKSVENITETGMITYGIHIFISTDIYDCIHQRRFI